MGTYEGRTETKSLGLGGIIVRIGAAAVLGWAGLTGGHWLYEHVIDNAPLEQGFVDPNALKIDNPKNAAGNRQAILQFKNGASVDSLPCMKGYAGGVVCGNVEYLVDNFTPKQREGIVVGQFPNISNDAKRGIVGGELQSMLDSFYGVQKSAQQQAYQQAAKK